MQHPTRRVRDPAGAKQNTDECRQAADEQQRGKQPGRQGDVVPGRVLPEWLDFAYADFADGRGDFTAAVFSGGRVSFARAAFSGGEVDLSRSTVTGTPPVFDSWADGPPDGLLFPPDGAADNDVGFARDAVSN